MSFCGSRRYQLTDEYFYWPGGIPHGFSFAVLKVGALDSSGFPNAYSDSIRIDLHRKLDDEREKIFFFKENEGYDWRTFPKGEKPPVLPIPFQQRSWYVIWGNDFKDGILGTNHHSFFFYIDSAGRMIVYEKNFQTNF